MRKRLRQLALAVAGVLVLGIVAVVIAGSTVTLTGEQSTPSGHRRNESHYLTMRDGVQIAIDVWFPAALGSGEQVPTLMRATRYGRAYNIGFAMRVLVAFGRVSDDPNLHPDVRSLNEQGYAVVRVDARGSGASFGQRPIEWSAAEVADYGEVIEWITQQPWSNGRVGAYGVSYDGNSAEVTAATGHPALKGVAPLFSYFDPFQDLIRPGGVFDTWFMERWSSLTARMDTRLPCRGGTLRCLREKLLSDGIKPVDSDHDGRLRMAAATGRANPTVLDSLANVEFRDDHYGISGDTFDARTPRGLAAQIEASGVALNVWTGWHDSAAVDGALARYATLDNPQRLTIGPLTHGGKHDTDPFAAADRPVQPSLAEQYRAIGDFFAPLLKQGAAPASVTREIRYYTLGENKWKSTAAWPPQGVAMERWFFAAGNELHTQPPGEAHAFDTYQVDFTASTGARSRWHTIGGPDVRYPDRRDEDRKLLVYTSEPLMSDTEITGNARVTLNLAASASDAALHVYLEDVAPDGTVTYLTEGVLRAANRRAADQSTGSLHSLRRTDALPLEPGVNSEIAIGLYAISARLSRGHRIRVAIAGANADVFAPLAAEQGVVFTVQRGAVLGSYVDLPIVHAAAGVN